MTYSIRSEPIPDSPESAPTLHLDLEGREVALFTHNEHDAHDAETILRAANDYAGMRDAVKDLVFLVGQMPAAVTINDQELNRAYRKASDYLREDWERTDGNKI